MTRGTRLAHSVSNERLFFRQNTEKQGAIDLRSVYADGDEIYSRCAPVRSEFFWEEVLSMFEQAANCLPKVNRDRAELQSMIRLQLMALGYDTGPAAAGTLLAKNLLANYRETIRLLKDYRCPIDRRIETFLADICRQAGFSASPRLPSDTFVLATAGMARELSLPMEADFFETRWLKSYHVRNGVLHNPRSDRRTTQGTFHVADAGLPVPADKIAVPLSTFIALFNEAFKPPAELAMLPYTARYANPAHLFCSLLLRPLVCPPVPADPVEKRMEIRFFAPGALVSNLDFVEEIFGNAGDPMLPENDAGLDVEGWSGHTGCVILAPHLVSLTKKTVGLPHWDQATERQRADGACWKAPDELYNNGSAFKLTCRSEAGVMVTLIADNYYGYCKKEVKTQISFASNLFGSCEEEHAGGALAFPSYSHGAEYHPSAEAPACKSVEQIAAENSASMDLQPGGWGIDKKYPFIYYIPHTASFDLPTGRVSWRVRDKTISIPLLTERVYVATSGQRFFLTKHPGTGRYRVTTTVPDGVFCHKPCTVSGGGKSEISKSLLDYMIYGPIYVSDLQKDIQSAAAIIDRDFSVRWRPGKEPHDYSQTPSRRILDPRRSLGSVIKLLTPSSEYTDEFNAWLKNIPAETLALVFLIKRFYQPDWGNDWQSHFSVDIINGEPGHELKVDGRKAGGTYLRVGLLKNGGWRTFKLRQDFYPAAKVQTEDDITASTVAPVPSMENLAGAVPGPGVKVALNCEYKLFQRPDEAIHPGFDAQTEFDLSQPHNFITNFEPLKREDVQEIVNHVVAFDAFTDPMKKLLSVAAESDGYCVCSAHPRLVDGKASKNPRYLQTRPDLTRPHERYLAEIGVRLMRGWKLDAPVVFGVGAVLMGRRNNPPEPGIRTLAVYNPIHYQELPELFMELICSLTGKSPSTTGAGSEGALTKGPFNALLPSADLNAALISFILTGLGGFSTAAGFIGPHVRVDHDISLLVPELWCRLTRQERDPRFLIANGYMDRLEDFDYEGRRIPASRLGYRINYNFVRTFLGRIFDNPARVFDHTMLAPESQGMAEYVDGIMNIVETQQRVAKGYFADGSYQQACPPLQALLSIMADGHYNGLNVHHPDIRRMFTRDYLLASDWYMRRLQTRQKRDAALWQRNVAYVKRWIEDHPDPRAQSRLQIQYRLAVAQKQLARVQSDDYLRNLQGYMGADPLGS